MLKVVKDAAVSSDATVIGGSLLDQLARDGARQMLASALLAEVAAYVRRTRTRSIPMATDWWSATASTPSGR